MSFGLQWYFSYRDIQLSVSVTCTAGTLKKKMECVTTYKETILARMLLQTRNNNSFLVLNSLGIIRACVRVYCLCCARVTLFVSLVKMEGSGMFFCCLDYFISLCCDVKAVRWLQTWPWHSVSFSCSLCCFCCWAVKHVSETLSLKDYMWLCMWLYYI